MQKGPSFVRVHTRITGSETVWAGEEEAMLAPALLSNFQLVKFARS